jgi:hypothetical protein
VKVGFGIISNIDKEIILPDKNPMQIPIKPEKKG